MKSIIKIALLGLIVSSCSHLKMFTKKEKRHPFTKISPIFHVDKIKAPLFVVHGANDPRVKKAEADQIVSSLSQRGIQPLYMVKYDEGHGFMKEENKIEFYTLMEQF